MEENLRQQAFNVLTYGLNNSISTNTNYFKSTRIFITTDMLAKTWLQSKYSS